MLRSDNIQITGELLNLFAEINEFKEAWRAFGTLAPERLNALRRVATIESIGSSTRIEGSRLSDRDVAGLLSNLHIQSFASRDEQEVAGYARVMETVFQSGADIRITENHIKQLHRDLLSYGAKDDLHRGAYKTTSNRVVAFDETGRQIGIVFETATPFATPPGYAYVPDSSLESVIEHSKEGYYLALRQTQGTIRTAAPDWQPWLLFFLRALQQQKRRLAEKVEREKLVLAALPELAVQIVDHARQHGRVTIGDMVRLTGASRNTLKVHFRQLVERGHLKQHGLRKGTWYGLP